MRVNAMVINEEYAATRQEERFLQRHKGPLGARTDWRSHAGAKYGRKMPHSGQDG